MSKILRAHLSTGNLNPGEDITVGVDQILLEDATGTTAAMQFEMLDIDTVAVPLAVVYIDHAVHGIRVNCIAPGPVYTPHVAAASMPDELHERRRLASPLKLEGTAWDVAHTAVYFASDESRWVTGVVVPVDGGVVLSRASRKQS